jgi:hypothetical protein
MSVVIPYWHGMRNVVVRFNFIAFVLFTTFGLFSGLRTFIVIVTVLWVAIVDVEVVSVWVMNRGVEGSVLARSSQGGSLIS